VSQSSHLKAAKPRKLDDFQHLLIGNADAFAKANQANPNPESLKIAEQPGSLALSSRDMTEGR
jgi:hypothetical protein